MTTSALLVVLAIAARASAQPPQGGGGGGGGGGTTYKSGVVPQAATLRGTVGTVDTPIDSAKTLIYGPFEAGFSVSQTAQLFKCSPGITVAAGLDTLTAEQVVIKSCSLPDSTSVLDTCGGHANPYHYHERMTCLYTSDPTTGHSTRIATMSDGNGLYGKYVAKDTLPTDLDACGGRKGVTPDSNGQEVYYYMVQDKPPFTIGCYGPVSSVAECRALYSTCGDGDTMSVTTKDGTRDYDPDCPCFEPSSGPGGVTNIVGAGTTGSTTGGTGSTDSTGSSTGSSTGTGTVSPATAGGAPRIGIGAAHSLVAALLASILTFSCFIR